MRNAHPPKNTDSNKSTTALRALKVLEILGGSRVPVSVASVAEGIEADRSTAYRMLMTLMDAGYVLRDTTSKHYKLSYKVLSIAKFLLQADDTAELILGALRDVSRQTRETVHYAVLDRDETVLIHRVKGTQLVSVDFQIGDRSTLHCTSIGKLLLSYEDTARIEQFLQKDLPKVARRTITDPDLLRTELRKVRRQGYAFDDCEFADDMRCVAVPVFDKNGRVHGGISLSGPSSRYTHAKLDALRDCALAAAANLSRQLGYGVGDR